MTYTAHDIGHARRRWAATYIVTEISQARPEPKVNDLADIEVLLQALQKNVCVYGVEDRGLV